MARVITKTFRGAVKSDRCVFGSQAYLKRWSESSNKSYFDNPVNNGGDDYNQRKFTLPSALTEGRFGMKYQCATGIGNSVRLGQFKESAGGTERLQLFRNEGFAGVYAYVGGTYYYTAAKDFFSNNPSVLVPNVIEVYWLCNGASGIVKIWLNGILVIEVNPVNIGTAGIQFFNMGGYSTYPAAMDVEWIIVNDAGSKNEELSFLKFARVRPSGAGNTTGMTPKPSGDNYTLVDDTLDFRGADYVLADAADEKDTYATENCPAAVSTIKAFTVNGVAALQAESALKAKPIVRVGSTDYEGEAITVTRPSHEVVKRWETNPNTSAAWQTSEINGAEIGMKAVSA